MKGNDSRRPSKGGGKPSKGKGKNTGSPQRDAKGSRGKGKTKSLGGKALGWKGKHTSREAVSNTTGVAPASPTASAFKGKGKIKGVGEKKRNLHPIPYTNTTAVEPPAILTTPKPVQPPSWLAAPAEQTAHPQTMVDLMRQRDPFWHGHGVCSSKFRIRSEGCYPIEGSLWGQLAPESTREIAQHQAALAKLFPLHAYHSALAEHTEHERATSPVTAASHAIQSEYSLGDARSLVVNVATRGHFRTLPITAQQLVEAVASGFYANRWSEPRHRKMPAWLKHRFAAGLISVPLPWDVQRELGMAFWAEFESTEPMKGETLATLELCVPSDDELSSVEAHLEALGGRTSRLGGAERFVHLIGNTPGFLPWLQFLQLKADLREQPQEIAEFFQGQSAACNRVVESRAISVVLQLVLAVGNCLNHSTAQGFDLDSLRSAALTKTREVEGNLVHYIAVVAAELLCGGDLEQLRQLIGEDTWLLGEHSSGEVFEGIRREMGDLINRMAMVQASVVAHRVSHLLDQDCLLQLQSQYHAADVSLHSLNRFFSSTASAFDLLSSLKAFFRTLQGCCADPTTRKLVELRSKQEPVAAGISHRRFNWTAIAVEPSEDGIWQSGWKIDNCMPADELAHILRLDTSRFFSLSKQHPRVSSLGRNTTAAAAKPVKLKRTLGCDLHLLGIKLGSRRLLSRGRQVVKILETLQPSLEAADLSVILQAFPSRGDQRVLQQFHMQKAIDNWRGSPSGVRGLSCTEEFLWQISTVEDGQQRAELLLNLQNLPEDSVSLAEQVGILDYAGQALLASTQVPAMLRLVRLICSVLNKERIKGFCLASLDNLQDTRCVTARATLENYVAFAAPLVGVDPELASTELAQCAGTCSHPVEALHSNLSRMTWTARNAYDILKRLPESPQTQTIEDQLNQSAAQIDTLRQGAQRVLERSAEIRSMFPGSGSAANVVSTLQRFVARLKAPDQKAQQAIGEVLDASMFATSPEPLAQ